MRTVSLLLRVTWALLATLGCSNAFVLPGAGNGAGKSLVSTPRSALATRPLASTARMGVRLALRPEDEDDEERAWAAMRRRQQEKDMPGEDDYRRRIGEEGEEAYEAGDVVRTPVSYQLQFSVFDDLWPTMSRIWKSVVLLDREGTKRRSAQMTIISVSIMSASLGLLFLALLPAGFIHGPDPALAKVRPTYQTKTYINPDQVSDKRTDRFVTFLPLPFIRDAIVFIYLTLLIATPLQVLEDDFYRAGGAVSWENLMETDDDF